MDAAVLKIVVNEIKERMSEQERMKRVNWKK
jgi:hypothetical protein